MRTLIACLALALGSGVAVAEPDAPLPKPAAPAKVAAAPIEAKILKAEVKGERTEYTLDKGTEAGVGKKWTAELVSEGKSLGPATVVRIDKVSTVVVSSVKLEPMPKDLGVRLSRP